MGTLQEWLYFVASAANLCLANLVVFRARRARGALPIALLCVSLFLWDFGRGAFYHYHEEYWSTISLIGSSMSPGFLWHFVLVFAGRDRPWRVWLVLVYVATGLFTLSTAGAFVSPFLQDYVRGGLWNLIYLGAFFPLFFISIPLVLLRKKEAQTPVERNAANFVVAGLAVAVLMGFTELVHRFWDWIPHLGQVGSVLVALLLAVAILRHRLLEKQAPVRKLFFFLVMGASAVVVIGLLAIRFPDPYRAAFLFGAVALTTLIALYRTVFTRLTEQAARRQRLALIGTMAAGVAHEIRNPLASIKGAAQFVLKDLESTSGKEEARDYLTMLVGEVDRLNGVVESFLTYARPVDPRRQELALEVFLKDLLRIHAASIPAGVRVETYFDPDLPPVRVDPQLLTHAVTNAIRNAVEVMPEGGTLTIRTAGVASAIRSYAAIEVEDTGPGIPRGEVDRIFQPFYTTKAKGTGLGLAISLRILEAHGGDISVQNVEPHGCRFTFLLPLSVL